MAVEKQETIAAAYEASGTTGSRSGPSRDRVASGVRVVPFAFVYDCTTTFSSIGRYQGLQQLLTRLFNV